LDRHFFGKGFTNKSRALGCARALDPACHGSTPARSGTWFEIHADVRICKGGIRGAREGTTEDRAGTSAGEARRARADREEMWQRWWPRLMWRRGWSRRTTVRLYAGRRWRWRAAVHEGASLTQITTGKPTFVVR
jgi:hypothetical protein